MSIIVVVVCVGVEGLLEHLVLSRSEDFYCFMQCSRGLFSAVVL